MSIIEALQKEDGVRVCYENRWLVFDSDEFIVYAHLYGNKKNDVLIRTENENRAVRVLLDGHE